MTRPSLLTSVLATAALACAALVAATPAQAAPTPLPPHVFAPYFEVWTGEDPAVLAQQSGASHLTLSFLQTAKKGSCDLVWDGDAARPVSQAEYGASIATIRSRGGDVIPALGGYGAGSTGTELADSCTDVDKIAAAMQKVVTTYDVTRIDIDVEDASLTNTAGIDRRNKAIKKVEDWAAASGRTIQFVYTLPTTTRGLGDTGMDVMRNAVSNGARIDIVNLMTFDYYDNASHDMAADTRTATTGLVSQLKGLYPGRTDAQLWAMVGVTEMIGIDDFGPAETFTTANAAPVLEWARNKGISYLSFWALQRDNGGCPGVGGANECSGIAQPTWFFTQAFEPFTSGGTTPTPTPTATPTVTPTVTPTATPTATPTSGTCTAAAWSATKAYSGGALVSSAAHTWKAKWWTQGDVPGNDAQGVWLDQGPCSGTPTPTASPTVTPTATPTVTPTATPTSGTCTAAAWSATKAYSGGALVSSAAHTWKAKWWTQGDVPGSNAQGVWLDQGPC